VIDGPSGSTRALAVSNPGDAVHATRDRFAGALVPADLAICLRKWAIGAAALEAPCPNNTVRAEQTETAPRAVAPVISAAPQHIATSGRARSSGSDRRETGATNAESDVDVEQLLVAHAPGEISDHQRLEPVDEVVPPTPGPDLVPGKDAEVDEALQGGNATSDRDRRRHARQRTIAMR